MNESEFPFVLTETPAEFLLKHAIPAFEAVGLDFLGISEDYWRIKTIDPDQNVMQLRGQVFKSSWYVPASIILPLAIKKGSLEDFKAMLNSKPITRVKAQQDAFEQRNLYVLINDTWRKLKPIKEQ